jgi:hypothetical protein
MAEHLALNGGRSIIHATKRFWRHEIWPLGRQEAVARARMVLIEDSRRHL